MNGMGHVPTSRELYESFMKFENARDPGITITYQADSVNRDVVYNVKFKENFLKDGPESPESHAIGFSFRGVSRSNSDPNATCNCYFIYNHDPVYPTQDEPFPFKQITAFERFVKVHLIKRTISVEDLEQRLNILESNNTKFENMMRELLHIFRLHVEGSV